jgi:hypothetical protein
MKEIDVQDRDTYNSKVKKLKIQYIVPLVIFSILFGFTMYFSKNTILNSIAGGNQGAELRGDVLGNTIRSPMVALRIGTLILVLAVIVIRIVVQKRKTNGS